MIYRVWGDVADRDAMPSLQQIFCHWLTHYAQTDESDFFHLGHTPYKYQTIAFTAPPRSIARAVNRAGSSPDSAGAYTIFITPGSVNETIVSIHHLAL
jgi:hypothetical protein